MPLAGARIPAEHEQRLDGRPLAQVPADQVVHAILYGAIGAFHYLFRKKFLAISMNHQKAEDSGLNVKFWDFLFYASFGFVVTSSVSIAGVLLVFSYLIVPALAGVTLGGSVVSRLLIGWAFGTIVSVLGMVASAAFDLPTGATVVCAFGLTLIVFGLGFRFGWLRGATPLS